MSELVRIEEPEDPEVEVLRRVEKAEMEVMIWTRKMAVEMALSYAHGAHEANGQLDPYQASVLASVSMAWSQVASLIGNEGARLVLGFKPDEGTR